MTYTVNGCEYHRLVETLRRIAARMAHDTSLDRP